MAENRVNTTSRRSNLRINGQEQHIDIKTEFEDAQATLVNISSGGAYIDMPSCNLSEGDKLLLIITLDEPALPMEIQAIITRKTDKKVALEFISIQENIKKNILKYFTEKLRQNNSGWEMDRLPLHLQFHPPPGALLKVLWL